MSNGLGASDEDLIKKSDEDHEGKLSFFDNTIDESENDITVESPLGHEKKEEIVNNAEAGHSEHEKKGLRKGSKSFMELEVKKDKMRWLYMSELGSIFGEEKHTREGFIKLFGTRVSSGELSERNCSERFLKEIADCGKISFVKRKLNQIKFY